MDNKPSKEISRRDAIKILAAVAGATALANLPSKWNTPELAAGVLPAHAQTSFGVACDPDVLASSGIPPYALSGPMGATIAPPTPGVTVSYQLTANPGVTINSPALTGTAVTDGAGHVQIIVSVTITSLPSSITASFGGSTNCVQTVTFPLIPPINGDGNSSGGW